MPLRFFSKILFKLTGWTCENEVPPELKKYVLIGAPHTSNYDFIFGICALSIMKLKTVYLAKKQLFVFPIKWIFTSTGGIPVDRSKKGNMVNMVVEMLRENKHMIVLIPPEGTRGKVERWKTGFYHAAVNAGVPIVLGYLDYSRKKGGLGQVFYPTGNIKADFEVIKDFYRNIKGRHPEKFDIENIKPE
jgi:1-acyl-sn-glycerol-3-phosphate acyltransferase